VLLTLADPSEQQRYCASEQNGSEEEPSAAWQADNSEYDKGYRDDDASGFGVHAHYAPWTGVAFGVVVLHPRNCRTFLAGESGSTLRFR
jgi:hypothetical protein